MVLMVILLHTDKVSDKTQMAALIGSKATVHMLHTTELLDFLVYSMSDFKSYSNQLKHFRKADQVESK